MSENEYTKNKRPTFNPDVVLFPTGFENIVEIISESRVGKILIQFLMKNCIMPKEYKGMLIGGQNVGVVLIDTDIKLNNITFVNFLQYHVQSISGPKLFKKEIIEKALKNFFLIRCCNTDVLLHLVCKQLDKLLSQNHEIVYEDLIMGHVRQCVSKFPGVCMLSRRNKDDIIRIASKFAQCSIRIDKDRNCDNYLAKNFDSSKVVTTSVSFKPRNDHISWL